MPPVHFLIFYFAFNASWIMPSYLYAIEHPKPPTVISRPYEPEPIEIPEDLIDVEPVDSSSIIIEPEHT